MNEDSDWDRLDCAVGNLLINLPSVFERVSLLEDSIYSQGALIFEIVSKKHKNINGLNRRARHSIE